MKILKISHILYLLIGYRIILYSFYSLMLNILYYHTNVKTIIFTKFIQFKNIFMQFLARIHVSKKINLQTCQLNFLN